MGGCLVPLDQGGGVRFLGLQRHLSRPLSWSEEALCRAGLPLSQDSSHSGERVVRFPGFILRHPDSP